MKKIGIVLAGLWLALHCNFAAAQQPPKTYPVTAQVSGDAVHSPVYAQPSSGPITITTASGSTCLATHAGCDCKPICYSGCAPSCGACASPCGCQESCFSKLCRWLCYKPTPVPCDCLGHCNHCAPCVPPLYALFLRPGNCTPCSNCTYATSCCFPH